MCGAAWLGFCGSDTYQAEAAPVACPPQSPQRCASVTVGDCTSPHAAPETSLLVRLVCPPPGRAQMRTQQRRPLNFHRTPPALQLRAVSWALASGAATLPFRPPCPAGMSPGRLSGPPGAPRGEALVLGSEEQRGGCYQGPNSFLFLFKPVSFCYST